MTRDARNEREAHAMLQQHVRNTSGEPLMGREPWIEPGHEFGRFAWFLFGAAWAGAAMAIVEFAK